MLCVHLGSVYAIQSRCRSAGMVVFFARRPKMRVDFPAGNRRPTGELRGCGSRKDILKPASYGRMENLHRRSRGQVFACEFIAFGHARHWMRGGHSRIEFAYAGGADLALLSAPANNSGGLDDVQ